VYPLNSRPFLYVRIWYRALALDHREPHPAQEMSAKLTEAVRTWLDQMEPLVVAAFPVFCLFWDPCWVAAVVVV